MYFARKQRRIQAPVEPWLSNPKLSAPSIIWNDARKFLMHNCRARNAFLLFNMGSLSENMSKMYLIVGRQSLITEARCYTNLRNKAKLVATVRVVACFVLIVTR